jgi:hypothetical protein
LRFGKSFLQLPVSTQFWFICQQSTTGSANTNIHQRSQNQIISRMIHHPALRHEDPWSNGVFGYCFGDPSSHFVFKQPALLAPTHILLLPSSSQRYGPHRLARSQGASPVSGLQGILLECPVSSQHPECHSAPRALPSSNRLGPSSLTILKTWQPLSTSGPFP